MINREKVTLYLKNSTSFLFGVFDNAKNYSHDPNKDKGIMIDGHRYGIWQGAIYNEVNRLVADEAIFPWDENKKVSYDKATGQLLEKLGIDGIIKKIILPYQAESLSLYEIGFLRRCWSKGLRPGSEAIKYDDNADKINPINFFTTGFVEYYVNQSAHNPLNLVKGWTQWAFVYFGELDEEKDMRLENYIKEKQK